MNQSPFGGSARRNFNLPTHPDPLPFTEGVLVGNFYFLSGRIGIDPTTGMAPANLDQEIEFLFDGMEAILAKAGMRMDDLVYVQVFCSDLSLFDKFNAAYRRQFTRDFPARAFIGSGPLLRGGHFEMQGIAIKQ